VLRILASEDITSLRLSRDLNVHFLFVLQSVSSVTSYETFKYVAVSWHGQMALWTQSRGRSDHLIRNTLPSERKNFRILCFFFDNFSTAYAIYTVECEDDCEL